MNTKNTFIKLQTVMVYSNLFHISINRTISLIEDLHKTIDNFVYDVQHHADKPILDIQRLTHLRQQRISKSYQFVRDINSRLGMATAEFLGTLQHRDNLKLLTKLD